MNGKDEEIGCGVARPVQVRRVRKGGWRKATRAKFLSVLADTCNVRIAAEACGMRYGGAYRLRARDPAFAALWQEALGIGYERLENALLAHALTSLNAIEIGVAEDGDDEGDDNGHRATEDVPDTTSADDAVRATDPTGGVPRGPQADRECDPVNAAKRGLARGLGNATRTLSPKILGASDVQVALAILNRHRASVEGKRTAARTSRRRTQEEIDALLRVQLDRLATKLARSDALMTNGGAAEEMAAGEKSTIGGDNGSGVMPGDGTGRRER